MNVTIESTKSSREVLKNLEAENKYVFHGTEVGNLLILEPRQAYNNKNGVKELDGDPAVFASSNADYAIMMALINANNCPNGFRSGASSIRLEDGRVSLRLRTSREAIKQLNDKTIGYVYVFDKTLFSKRNADGVEYMSVDSVCPVKQITVTKVDLSPDLELME